MAPKKKDAAKRRRAQAAASKAAAQQQNLIVGNANEVPAGPQRFADLRVVPDAVEAKGSDLPFALGLVTVPEGSLCVGAQRRLGHPSRLRSVPDEHVIESMKILSPWIEKQVGEKKVPVPLSVLEMAKILLQQDWDALPIATLQPKSPSGKDEDVSGGGTGSETASGGRAVCTAPLVAFRTSAGQVLHFFFPARVTLPDDEPDGWFPWEYDYVAPGTTVKWPKTKVFRQCPVCRKMHQRGELTDDGSDRQYIMAAQIFCVPDNNRGVYSPELGTRINHRQRLFCESCFFSVVGDAVFRDSDVLGGSCGPRELKVKDLLSKDTHPGDDAYPFDYGLGTFPYPKEYEVLPATVRDILFEMTRLKAALIDSLMTWMQDRVEDGQQKLAKALGTNTMITAKVIADYASGEREATVACWGCQVDLGKSKCGKCRMARYCSALCQKEDWRFHRNQCEELLRLRKQAEGGVSEGSNDAAKVAEGSDAPKVREETKS